jgi:hypothetical protein
MAASHQGRTAVAGWTARLLASRLTTLRVDDDPAFKLSGHTARIDSQGYREVPGLGKEPESQSALGCKLRRLLIGEPEKVGFVSQIRLPGQASHPQPQHSRPQ